MLNPNRMNNPINAQMKNILEDVDYPLPKYDGLSGKVYMVLYYQDIENLVQSGFLDAEIYSKDSNPIICVFNK